MILVDNEITTVIGATRQDIQALEPEDRQAMYTRLADKLTAFDGIEAKFAGRLLQRLDKIKYIGGAAARHRPLMSSLLGR